eukprot:CAMPEP_0180577238 /NCGR_PEP_ID=MMETSP1037_2-20121125/11832_1 /TAXON_ID=632150 /ORGANISM="Azadinium spinosum, Strain 3D9" /LENGTH=31 /DNA_ID= /DNA_START= /DNA_END= /DNA_ORIENTATION=
MYLEHLWQEGDPKSLGSNTLAALEHFVPSTR